MATDNQINYIMHLLSMAGYSTRYMDLSFAKLGATRKQRSGSVRGWLTRMENVEASKLIDRLKSRGSDD